MATGEWNHQLEQAMADAGLSQKALARMVRQLSARDVKPLATNHTAVSRWLRGMVPREQTATYVVQALSSRIGRTLTLADIGMDKAGRIPAELGLVYAPDLDGTLGTLTQLWRADLDGDPAITGTEPTPIAWAETSLRWLIGAREPSATERAAGRRVGVADVEALCTTADMFVALDNRFGGAHARTALIRYLADDVEPMLSGSHTEPVRQALFVAAAEATLLAAWMSYDSCKHGLAQRYFIQALRLAEAGGDRLLAGSIMSAMSHQATFVGRYHEAADLARAAVAGIAAVGTDTLRAQFHAMEARALSRLGDRRACDLAMADAVTHFERRNIDADPAWISYFDESELAAELGHCHRDLGRAVDATTYASQSLSPDGSYVRSDFFATMVLADSYVVAGEIEEACHVAGRALELGRSLKSSRCRGYVREFKERLMIAGAAHPYSELALTHVGHPLLIAS